MKGITLALLATVCVSQIVLAEEVVFSEAALNRLNAEHDLSKREMFGTVDIAPGLRLPFRVGITSKGNGALTVGGLSIRFYDGHQDLKTFAGGCLSHRLSDIDQDGYKDLVFYGTVEQWGEKGEFLAQRPVVSVFRFSPTTRRFVNTLPDSALEVITTDT
jgi:hypothetical protein